MQHDSTLPSSSSKLTAFSLPIRYSPQAQLNLDDTASSCCSRHQHAGQASSYSLPSSQAIVFLAWSSTPARPLPEQAHCPPRPHHYLGSALQKLWLGIGSRGASPCKRQQSPEASHNWRCAHCPSSSHLSISSSPAPRTGPGRRKEETAPTSSKSISAGPSRAALAVARGGSGTGKKKSRTHQQAQSAPSSIITARHEASHGPTTSSDNESAQKRAAAISITS
jgi:hypothetical protein